MREIQRAVIEATHQAEQTAFHRMVAYGVAAPLFTKSLLTLVMAHEVLGKSLLKCSATELEEVHQAVAKMLLATGTASPFRRAELPKPKPEGDDQGGGNYL